MITPSSYVGFSLSYYTVERHPFRVKHWSIWLIFFQEGLKILTTTYVTHESQFIWMKRQIFKRGAQFMAISTAYCPKKRKLKSLYVIIAKIVQISQTTNGHIVHPKEGYLLGFLSPIIDSSTISIRTWYKYYLYVLKFLQMARNFRNTCGQSRHTPNVSRKGG